MTSQPMEQEVGFSAETLDALANFLRAKVRPFSGSLSVKPLAGGQSNPTYLVNAAGENYVVRRKPPGQLLNSAHAVEREYRVLAALRDSEMPVPQVYALCEDSTVIGTPFYVMEFVQGRTFWDPSLPGMTLLQRSAIYDALNQAISTLHKVDYAACGLHDFGKPANFLARQLSRWTRQYRESQTETITAMENLISWLPDNLPAAEETSIVHGDFRIDNIIFHQHEPRIVAVLDWELSTLGNPLVDFAYHCMTWHVTPDEFRGLKGHDLTALGIPLEHEYVRRYCERMGRGTIEDWNFYLVYNMFRMSAILQGILWRAQNGTAFDVEAAKTGRLARPMADAGWRHVNEIWST